MVIGSQNILINKIYVSLTYNELISKYRLLLKFKIKLCKSKIFLIKKVLHKNLRSGHR